MVSIWSVLLAGLFSLLGPGQVAYLPLQDEPVTSAVVLTAAASVASVDKTCQLAQQLAANGVSSGSISTTGANLEDNCNAAVFDESKVQPGESDPRKNPKNYKCVGKSVKVSRGANGAVVENWEARSSAAPGICSTQYCTAAGCSQATLQGPAAAVDPVSQDPSLLSPDLFNRQSPIPQATIQTIPYVTELDDPFLEALAFNKNSLLTLGSTPSAPMPDYTLQNTLAASQQLNYGDAVAGTTATFNAPAIQIPTPATADFIPSSSAPTPPSDTPSTDTFNERWNGVQGNNTFQQVMPNAYTTPPNLFQEFLDQVWPLFGNL